MKKRRHLAIDAVGAKWGGSETVLLGTLEAAARCSSIARVTVFCSPRSTRRFDLPEREWLEVEERPREEQSKLARLAWLCGGLSAAARRRGADALLALNGARGGASVVPTTVFAQQSVPLVAEAMDRMSPGARLRMWTIGTLLWDATRYADRIAVQTSWMRDAVVNQLGADVDRVVVVGVASKYHQRDLVSGDSSNSSSCSQGGSVLYVGSDAPYKNLSVLAPAMRLVRRIRPLTRLVATVPARHATESDGVECVGYLNDDALAAAYGSADVVVFPSLVESAGLPLAEAMSFGVPVVAADRPYAHDMCGEAALYFDPHRPEALANRIITVLGDDALRDHMRHEGVARAAHLREARPYERLVELAISVSSKGRASGAFG